MKTFPQITINIIGHMIASYSSSKKPIEHGFKSVMEMCYLDVIYFYMKRPAVLEYDCCTLHE